MSTLTEEQVQEYVEFTRETAKYPGAHTGNSDELSYLGLGLSNEIGEFLLKAYPDEDEASYQLTEIWDELSDACYYLVRTFDALAFDVPIMEKALIPSVIHQLCGRVGKVQGVIKKVLRDGLDVQGDTQARRDIHDWLIETMEAFVCVLHLYRTDLESIIKINTDKLSARKARGTLLGSGDNR